MRRSQKKMPPEPTRLSGDVYTEQCPERARASHAEEHPPQGLPGPVQRVLGKKRWLVGRGIPKVLKLRISLRVWFSRVNARDGVLYPYKTRGAFMFSHNVICDVTPEPAFRTLPHTQGRGA